MSYIRINDLAKELGIKSKAVLDYLPKVGIVGKKTHSSSLTVEEANRVRACIPSQLNEPTSSVQECATSGRDYKEAEQAIEMDVELTRHIHLKSLPNTDLPLRLAKEFGWKVDPLGQAARLLTEDKQRSFILHSSKAGRESFIVSTPRLQVRFFPDARDESSVIVLSVDSNSTER